MYVVDGNVNCKVCNCKYVFSWHAPSVGTVARLFGVQVAG